MEPARWLDSPDQYPLPRKAVSSLGLYWFYVQKDTIGFCESIGLFDQIGQITRSLIGYDARNADPRTVILALLSAALLVLVCVLKGLRHACQKKQKSE